jgi:hypothetical protein
LTGVPQQVDSYDQVDQVKDRGQEEGAFAARDQEGPEADEEAPTL